MHRAEWWKSNGPTWTLRVVAGLPLVAITFLRHNQFGAAYVAFGAAIVLGVVGGGLMLRGTFRLTREEMARGAGEGRHESDDDGL